MSPNELQANPWNTNSVDHENEEKLKNSIKRFGIFKPVVIREIGSIDEPDFEIIGGEHRWLAAKSLEFEQIPVVNLGRITDKQAKEISIADNSRYGSDDTVSLAELFSEIGDSEDIQNYLPYSDHDIKAIFSSVDIAFDDLELDDDDEDTIPTSEEPVAKSPPTHTIMRFKVPIKDAENITEKIEKIKNRQDFTHEDELTNAGDALVHIVLGPKTEDGE